MKRSNGPRLLPLFILVLVVVVIIFGIVSVGRALFSSNQNTKTNEIDTGRQALISTQAGSSVRMKGRGPIVANETFKSYQIDVSPEVRSMKVFEGYTGTVDQEVELGNNQSAYEQLVYALDKANMMRGVVPEDDAKNDIRGICATGYVYEYIVLKNNFATKRLWASTCDGSRGTLQASIGQLNNLFNTQIPDFEKLYPFRVQDAALHL